jgi:hypothetical protein
VEVRDEALGVIPGRTASGADLGLCISFQLGLVFPVISQLSSVQRRQDLE